MFTKQLRTYFPCLALMALLVGLSGCGWRSASAQARASNAPGRVRIALHVLDSQAGTPVVTLTDVALVRRLYTTVIALPPRGVACLSLLIPVGA
jgi:hypothetical protein